MSEFLWGVIVGAAISNISFFAMLSIHNEERWIRGVSNAFRKVLRR